MRAKEKFVLETIWKQSCVTAKVNHCEHGGKCVGNYWRNIGLRVHVDVCGCFYVSKEQIVNGEILASEGSDNHNKKFTTISGKILATGNITM